MPHRSKCGKCGIKLPKQAMIKYIPPGELRCDDCVPKEVVIDG